METERQIEVINNLEQLVSSRFNIETLNVKLSQIFNEKIEAEIIELEDDNELSDFNIMFESKNAETYGDFDIYFLPMRRTGYDGSDLYITEVGFEFH